MSNKLTEQQVKHVAKLSRLKLSEDEVHYFSEQLSNVLQYISQLSELNVDNVEPMAHPTEMTNRFRNDIITAPLPIDSVLANAPQKDPPYFKVPKVLGEDSSA